MKEQVTIQDVTVEVEIPEFDIYRRESFEEREEIGGCFPPLPSGWMDLKSKKIDYRYEGKGRWKDTFLVSCEGDFYLLYGRTAYSMKWHTAYRWMLANDHLESHLRDEEIKSRIQKKKEEIEKKKK